MLEAPCVMAVAAEPQGETLAIDVDGLGYFTVSEATGPPLWRFRFAR